MRVQRGRDFGWLWSAYAVSTYGTWIAFGAFPLVAIRVLHSGPSAVSALEAAGLAMAAVAAIPLGPSIERRSKRVVMIAADLVRFLAMASVPVAYLLGLLSYAQLLVVSAMSGTAGIAFTAASGAYLKHLVRGDRLLLAYGRLEGTAWAATAAGPPLGGLLIGMLGPVVTIGLDAGSYLLSALGLLRLRESTEPGESTEPAGNSESTFGEGGERKPGFSGCLAGWRLIRGDPVLRRLFLNSVSVGGLIMATGPLLAVLLLGEYHVTAWQYGLAFGVPSVAGLAGARLSARLAARCGRYRVLRVTGWLRSIFPVGLALARPGVPGLLVVIVVEGLLIACMGIFNPISATERLYRVPAGQASRILSAWSISGKLAQSGLMVGWGVLAAVTSPLTALTGAGVLLLATPLLLPTRTQLADRPSSGLDAAGRVTPGPPRLAEPSTAR